MKSKQAPKKRKPKASRPHGSVAKQAWILAAAEKRIVRKARFKFVGEVTDSLQRVCQTNLSEAEMYLVINVPRDWHFDVQAVCDGYTKGEIQIFHNTLFNDLDQEVKAMQNRVRSSANPNHLQRVSWFARVAEPGEEA